VKITVGSWFRLPRLGKEAFASLMKYGVTYDKTMGFRIDHQADIESVVRIISSAIDEEIELSVSCLVCGKEACLKCPYQDVCDRSKVSTFCLCDVHSSSDALVIYKKIFRDKLAA
jgi:hypothetical protein